MAFDQIIEQQLMATPRMLRLQNMGLDVFPTVSQAVQDGLKSVEALNLRGNLFSDYRELADDLNGLFPSLRYLIVTIPPELDEDDELIQEFIVVGDMQALNDLCLDEEKTSEDFIDEYQGIEDEFEENRVSTPQPLRDSPTLIQQTQLVGQVITGCAADEFAQDVKPGLTALRACDCKVNIRALVSSAATLEYLDLTTSELVDFLPMQLEAFSRLQCFKNEALDDQQIEEIIAGCDNILKINVFDLDENIPLDELKYEALLQEPSNGQVNVMKTEADELTTSAISSELIIRGASQEEVNRKIAELDDHVCEIRIFDCDLTYVPQPPFSNGVEVLVITGAPKLRIRESFDDLSYYHALKELYLDDSVFQAIDYKSIRFYCKHLTSVNNVELDSIASPVSANEVHDDEMAQLLEDVAKTQDASEFNEQERQEEETASSGLREEQLILKNDEAEPSMALQSQNEALPADSITADQIMRSIPHVDEYLAQRYAQHAEPQDMPERTQKYHDFELKLLPKNYINQTQLNLVIQEFHSEVQEILEHNTPEHPDFKQIYQNELATVHEEFSTLDALNYGRPKVFQQEIDVQPLDRNSVNPSNKLAFVLLKMADLQADGLKAQRESLQSVNTFYDRLSDQVELLQALQVNLALKRTLEFIRDAVGQQEELQHMLQEAFSRAMSLLKLYIQNLLFYRGKAQKDMFLEDVRANQELIKSDFIKAESEPKSNLFTPVQVTLLFQQALQAYQAAEVQKAGSPVAADLIDYTSFINFFNNQFFAIKFGKVFAVLKRDLYYQSIERNLQHALVGCISNCLKTNQIKFFASELENITEVCTDLLMGSVYEIDGRIEVMDEAKVEKKVKSFKAKRIPIAYWKDSLETIDKVLVVESIDEDITFDEMVGYVMQWKMAQ